jgi:hypothetical protein
MGMTDINGAIGGDVDHDGTMPLGAPSSDAVRVRALAPQECHGFKFCDYLYSHETVAWPKEPTGPQAESGSAKPCA